MMMMCHAHRPQPSHTHSPLHTRTHMHIDKALITTCQELSRIFFGGQEKKKTNELLRRRRRQRVKWEGGRIDIHWRCGLRRTKEIFGGQHVRTCATSVKNLLLTFNNSQTQTWPDTHTHTHTKGARFGCLCK